MYFWQLALLCQLGLVRPQLWNDVRETRTQQADGHQGQGFWGQLARSKNDKGTVIDLIMGQLFFLIIPTIN